MSTPKPHYTTSEKYKSVRQYVNARLYDSQQLTEHLGISNPSASQIYEWKEKWAETTEYVIDMESSDVRPNNVINQLAISKLYVLISYSRRKIYFFHESDYMIFKLVYS